jgi:sulfide:quinone oxidoreductase
VDAIEPRRVVIAGGGVGALEALMALADLGERRLQVRLLADREHFTLRPQQVGELWGGPPLRRDLRAVAEHFGATVERERLLSVDAERGVAVMASGARVSYDDLIVAVGAQPGTAYPDALTVGFGSLPGSLAAGAAGRVAIVVPPGTGWTLPAYQLALQTAASAPGRVTVVTGEELPLEAFGRNAAVAVARLLADHHITVATRTAAPIGGDVAALGDTVLALPLLHGPAVGGLPADFAGFHPVDEHQRVPGLATVHVVGDAAAGHVKQGGLAAQQAEVAARDIASRAGSRCANDPYAPVLRGKLVAPDGQTLYLRRALDGRDAGRCQDTPLWRPEGAMLAWRLTRWLEETTEAETGIDPLAPVARSADAHRA